MPTKTIYLRSAATPRATRRARARLRGRVIAAATVAMAVSSGCIEMGAGQGQPSLPLEPGVYAGSIVGTGEARYYFPDGSVIVDPLSDRAFVTIVIGDDGLPVPDGRGLVQRFGPLVVEIHPVSAAAGDSGYTETYDLTAAWVLPDGSAIFFTGAGTETLRRSGQDSMLFTRQWFLISLDGTIQVEWGFEVEVFE